MLEVSSSKPLASESKGFAFWVELVAPGLPSAGYLSYVGMKCVIKKILTHALRFGATYNIDFLKEIKASIGDDGIELFKNPTFGPYLNFPKCNFRDKSLSFSIKDFAIITGLKCKDEVATLDIPGIQDAPPPGPSTTTVNPKEVQSKDISGFENFSTSPPDQLVRSSSRVSGTSSPPPPKRRKKINTPKIKVSEPSQSE
ncbi:hypothetical protein MTR67_019133 [Solanum verrucosum]|uniref:Uncharacterized protein n=1 Tax=Solanum verrucosum TaxID=315347 RepID=A0AAF0TUF8_SOLVR|nr:hypothetical protein MTR67_019133 [Solanum verrucosum]